MGKRKKRTKRRVPAATTPAAPAGPAPGGAFPWWIGLRVLLIVATIFWIYSPALNGDWLWDDDFLIEHNPAVVNPQGLWAIWCVPGSLIDYYPLTASVEWLEWQLWPKATLDYHLTSVLLHLTSALLVWHLFRKLGLRLAWVGGLLFAVHPVLVESVAWMAELKNTLSLPPFLLAMCCWIDFERDRRPGDYILALLLFITAMLCKTTMVMFPVILLLYAWWRRDRIRWRDLVRTAPFFGVSAAFSLLILKFQPHGIGENLIPLDGFLSRLACAGLSISFYFSKAFLPVDLLPIYPQWKVDPPVLGQFLFWPVLAGAVAWLWTRPGRWARAVLLGLGFFVVNLLPFVGLHNISFMRFGWVMDHFLYLPIIGLLGVAIAALSQVYERLDVAGRRWEVAALVALALVLACGGRAYAGIFQNTYTLWGYTVQRFPAAWPAHNDLGIVLGHMGRDEEAAEQFREALQIFPGYPEAHNGLGIIYMKNHRRAEGIEQFREALRLAPEFQTVRDNLRKAEQLAPDAPVQVDR